MHQLQRVVHVVERRRQLHAQGFDLRLWKAHATSLDTLCYGGAEVARGGVLHEQAGDALDLKCVHEADDVRVAHLLEHLDLELGGLDLVRRELL